MGSTSCSSPTTEGGTPRKGEGWGGEGKVKDRVESGGNGSE